MQALQRLWLRLAKHVHQSGHWIHNLSCGAHVRPEVNSACTCIWKPWTNESMFCLKQEKRICVCSMHTQCTLLMRLSWMIHRCYGCCLEIASNSGRFRHVIEMQLLCRHWSCLQLWFFGWRAGQKLLDYMRECRSCKWHWLADTMWDSARLCTFVCSLLLHRKDFWGCLG